MKRAEMIFIFFLAFVSTMIIKEGLGLPLQDGFAPGPGFLPIVVGVLLLLNSIFLLYKNIKSNKDESFFEKVGGLKNLSIFIITFILVILFGEKIGLILSLSIFMVIVFRYIEKYEMKKCILVAIVSNLVFYVIFDMWLGINLPGLL
jgi:hypothetical protein